MSITFEQFEKQMHRAKTTDFVRDFKRAKKADKTKRYESLTFPAYSGSPFRTNCYQLAWLIAVCRRFKYGETRVIDHKTGSHVIVFD